MVATRVDPGEHDAVVRMIAAEQARPERNIAYAGTSIDEIRAELEELEPPWTETARVARGPNGQVSGAVVVECDAALGRAWMWGPWVDGDDEAWNSDAPALFDAALAQLGDDITSVECCGEVANVRLAELATGRGWKSTVVNHALTVDARTTATWPGANEMVRPARADDLPAIARLHDAEFTDTHTPAERLMPNMTVLVAPRGTTIAGYAAGRVQAGGEGYIEYVAVDAEHRGCGAGRSLVVALTRLLMDASPVDRVSLTVRDDNSRARRLYASLGFEIATSIVGYRS